MTVCDVAIIGSGMGGSTFAHCLKDSGLNVVVVERGDFLPKEPQNWDTHSVFAARRYHNAEAWLDGYTGHRFAPGVFYYVGGKQQIVRRHDAAVPRGRFSSGRTC